jgi:hypothetical protein
MPAYSSASDVSWRSTTLEKVLGSLSRSAAIYPGFIKKLDVGFQRRARA